MEKEFELEMLGGGFYYALSVAEIVKDFLKKNEDQSVAHEWDHPYRVAKIATEIIKKQKNNPLTYVDIEDLLAAVFLHDVRQPCSTNKRDHVDMSIIAAGHIMQNASYPEKRIKNVINIMSEHSSEEKCKKPSSFAAKVIYDADKIDGLGIFGIMRMFLYGGQRNWSPLRTVNWSLEKIQKAFPLYTEAGKEIAQKPFEQSISFLNTLKNDLTKAKLFYSNLVTF